MTRLELRAVVAAFLAATVVLGAVVCAAFGWTIVASALSIYALGVGAWLYHCVERLIVARRISTVRTAAKPLQPLLPVMAAHHGPDAGRGAVAGRRHRVAGAPLGASGAAVGRQHPRQSAGRGR